MVLLIATQIGGVANIAFQIAMIRSLSIEQYGELAAMFSLILVFLLPMEALRTTVAHQAGLLSRANREGDIPPLIRRWSFYLALLTILILLLGWLSSAGLTNFFHLSSSMPVILTVAIIGCMPFMLMFVGLLQGVQSFVWMSVVYQGWGVVRLVTGVVFVMLIARSASAGLAAHVVGLIFSMAVGLIGFRHVVRAPSTGRAPDFEGIRYCLLSIVILGGYAVLTYADVMLVKRFFPPTDAGLFAKAATVGRTIIFITVPVSMAMFPKVVSAGLTSSIDRRVFIRSLGLASMLVVATAFMVTVFARHLWLLFSGDWPDDEAVRLVRGVVWAMAPLGMTLLVVNFELAQRRFHIMVPILVLASAYVVGVTLWHESLLQVVGILAVVSVTSLVAILASLKST